MVRPDGTVKVLDFGLAKGRGRLGERLSLSMSPTRTNAMTGDGMILGTAAYMSPGAGARQTGGSPRRHLGVRLRPLRMPHGAAGRSKGRRSPISSRPSSRRHRGGRRCPAATPPRVRIAARTLPRTRRAPAPARHRRGAARARAAGQRFRGAGRGTGGARACAAADRGARRWRAAAGGDRGLRGVVAQARATRRHHVG